MKSYIYNKRFLITGHTGFKGSWLVLMLEKLGAKVCGYSKDCPENSLFNITKPNIEMNVIGNILDYNLLEKTINDFKPEYIIHLASQAYVDKSIENPIDTFNTNVVGLSNLLDIVGKTGFVKSVLVVTSDKCYKNLESDKPYKEDSILGAQDPYSTSKACQELAVESFRFTYYNKKDKVIPISTARASNVIGGGDFNQNRLVPYLLDSFANGERPTIRNPKSIRPWQNVLDVLGGYLTLVVKMEKDPSISGAYNFGPEEDGIKTVGELTEELSRNFEDIGFESKTTELSSFETKILKLDSSKSKEILGWKPRYSFKDTVCNLAEFTKKVKGGENIKNICIAQIEDYLERLNIK